MTELNKARWHGTDPFSISSLRGQNLLDIIYTQARIELCSEGKSLFYAKRFKLTKSVITPKQIIPKYQAGVMNHYIPENIGES